MCTDMLYLWTSRFKSRKIGPASKPRKTKRDQVVQHQNSPQSVQHRQDNLTYTSQLTPASQYLHLSKTTLENKQARPDRLPSVFPFPIKTQHKHLDHVDHIARKTDQIPSAGISRPLPQTYFTPRAIKPAIIYLGRQR